MSDGASVQLLGADEALADMRRWADQLGPQVADAVEPVGQGVASSVAGRVPRLTGALASSVEAEGTEEGVELQLGAGLPYAGWIEFGGSRGRPYMPQGRYLFPTMEEREAEFVRAASSAAEDSVGRFPWSTPA